MSFDKLAAEAEEEAKAARKKGWDLFRNPIKIERDALVKIIDPAHADALKNLKKTLSINCR